MIQQDFRPVPEEEESGIDHDLLAAIGTGVEPEDTDSGADIVQPFDPKLIRVDTRSFTVDLVLSRIKDGALVLNPGFQRKGGIWTEEAQSRLIESMLIRIPLPAFYFDATEEERWLVVDGLQRLTTLKRFVLDQTLRLRGLEFIEDLNGKTYDELPRNLQRRVAETQVTLYLIERGTPPEVKFNIFKRINTGGLPLSAQEIRHALNQGKATDLLAQLADSTAFKDATQRSIRDDRMGDRECVLRFLAFTLTPHKSYEPELDNFLNMAMARLNALPDDQLTDLASQFERAMRSAQRIFGTHAFRKQYVNQYRQYPINKALFEAWSVALNKRTDQELERLSDRSQQLNADFREILTKDRDFDNAITQGTGDARKVQLRFRTVEQIIAGVLQ